ISELNLDRFFETWDDIFIKVQTWIKENDKIPTRNDNKDFNSWLYSQRARYNNGTLPEEQIEKLKSVGFDLEGKGNEVNEQKWQSRLKEYVEFLDTNGNEPSYFGDEYEKALYLWASAQRAVKAGNAKNRKPLSKEREDALNAINF